MSTPFFKSGLVWTVGKYTGLQPGSCLKSTTDDIVKVQLKEGIIYGDHVAVLGNELPTGYTDDQGDPYQDQSAFETATDEFFSVPV